MLYVACNEKVSVREKRRLIQMLKEKGLEEDQLEVSLYFHFQCNFYKIFFLCK